MSQSLEFDNRSLEYQTVNSILENRAERIGGETAVIYGPDDHSFTFRDLDKTANTIGNSLLKLGVSKQEEVSVMMQHPLQTVLAMLGINKAGALYSPINYEYKGDVLSYQINDTDPEILLIEDRYVKRLNEIVDDLEVPPEIIVRETDAESESLDGSFDSSHFDALLEGPSSKPDVTVNWDDNASILYTSGTTGQPKGVLIPHRWIFANYSLPRTAVLNSDDVMHTSLPFYHVTAVYFDFAAALAVGGTTVIWDQFSTSEFWNRINRYEATTTTLISVMIPWLMNKSRSEDDHRNTLSKVRMAPIPDNYEELAERYAFDLLGTNYGSTESGCSIAAYVHAAKGDDGTLADLYRGATPEEVKEGAEAIGMPVVDDVPDSDYTYAGKPVDGIMEISIRDEQDEAVENGVGEICMRPERAGLIFQEYYGKADQTVEAWRNLWFHTGDAGYRDESGNYYFVDRMGGVIRRRGENISSMQVEEIVGSHDAISQVAAFPVPAEEGGEDEVAVAITLKEDAELQESALREYLSDRMPEFMYPKHVYFVDGMPTTGTNKVAKFELKERFQ